MKQTRQAVHAVRQSIFLRCLCVGSLFIRYLLLKLYQSTIGKKLRMLIRIQKKLTDLKGQARNKQYEGFIILFIDVRFVNRMMQ